MIILESIIIGIYILFLFFIFRLFIKTHLFIELFIIGFIKHLISYYIGIQSYYCKIHKNNKYIVKSSNIIIESIFEGLIFIYIGYILKIIINHNNFLYPFILGIIIHILADIYGIHKLFLIYNCYLKI